MFSKFLIIIILAFSYNYTSAKPDFLMADEAFKLSINGGNKNLTLTWEIANQYYLYHDQFLVESLDENIRFGNLQFEPSRTEKKLYIKIKDNRKVYYHKLSIQVPVIKGGGNIRLKASYQGCSEAGLCYPPQHKVLTATISSQEISIFSGNRSLVQGTMLESEQDQDKLFSLLVSKKFWFIIASFFTIGIGLSLTPCIFPMIPILSGIITGYGEHITPVKSFLLSLIYVLAMSITYTLAGILAAWSGVNLQILFQHPIALIFFTLLFVMLAMSMFGFYKLQLPLNWQRKLSDISNSQRQGSFYGAAIMGLLSALIIGPCIAPPLAAALAYISQTQEILIGGIALFVLAWGMGLPLLIIGISAGRLLPRAGKWMKTVNVIFGVMMLCVAITILDRLTPTWFEESVILIMWATLLIVSAIYMGALEPIYQEASNWQKFWKGLGIVLIAYGLILLISASAGGKNVLIPLKNIVIEAKYKSMFEPYQKDFIIITTNIELEQELKKAKVQNRPILLYFYADWCSYCKYMEREVFSDPYLQNSLKNFMLVKADITSKFELRKRFSVLAPPTILFLEHNGIERKEYRLVGKKSIEEILKWTTVVLE